MIAAAGLAPLVGPRLVGDALAAPLPAPVGSTVRVSQTPTGGAAAGPSTAPAISATGRYVAFSSAAANIVPNDTNGAEEVFLHDRTAGTTVRLVKPGGQPVGQGERAYDPAISADGGTVAFTLETPGADDASPKATTVVAWVRATGTSSFVAILPSGQRSPRSSQASVSGDGRFVAFVSADRLVKADLHDLPDVYRADLSTGATTLVSMAPSGVSPDGNSTAPSISADGRFVAFQSNAPDLVEVAIGPGLQVFIRDIAAVSTRVVSVDARGGPANGPSEGPSVSADASRVAFTSGASDLAGRDPNGSVLDVFVRDLGTNRTSLVSPVGSTTPSAQAAISPDGRVVAFALSGAMSTATLAAATGGAEVLAHHLDTGEIILISARPDDGPGGGVSVAPAVSTGGRHVVFQSTSPLLVPNDSNQASDVFVRDLPPVPAIVPSAIDFGGWALGTSSEAGRAALTNVGWGPLTVIGAGVGGTAAGDFPLVADGCAAAVLHRGQSCAVDTRFAPTALGNRSAVLRIRLRGIKAIPSVRLTGVGLEAPPAVTPSPPIRSPEPFSPPPPTPTPTPTLPPPPRGEPVLVVGPRMGPPGIVVIAEGSNFPADAGVVLAWSRGITPKLPPITTDAGGSFRVQVLVFHNDVIGDRELVAVPSGEGGSFPIVSARFRVVLAPAQPPSFVLQHLLGRENLPMIVQRR